MQSFKHGLRETLPNNEHIRANLKGELLFNSTLDAKVPVFPNSQSESLLSIGQVYDDRSVTLFHDKLLNMCKNDAEMRNFLFGHKQHNLVLQGYRSTQDGLHDIPFPEIKVNSITKKEKNGLELDQHVHAYTWSQIISIFQ